MKRAALALLVVPLVAFWLYGCDKAENPLDTKSQVSETPLFAPGGKVKPMPLPTGCQDLQVAKYIVASGEWECRNDETGGAGGGPTTYFAYHRIGSTGAWETTASSGITVSKQGPLSDDWKIVFPTDVSDCAVVINSEAETDTFERSGTTLWTIFGEAEFNLIAVCG
jgi:hypothetical protein